MHKYNIQAIQFDDDGVCSLVYMNLEEALRKEGAIWQTKTVSLAPNAGPLYSEARAILEAARELLEELERVYSREGAWLPSEEDSDPEEDDLGMGY